MIHQCASQFIPLHRIRHQLARWTRTYNVDWDRIESSVSPALASARLLHDARRMTDVSRWWTLRWTSNAVSLLSRACAIGTGKSCKLFRKLRRITTSYASELWLTIADRRHDANDQIEKEAVKAKWLRLQRLLGRAVNKRGLCMPGWVLVKNQPIYTIRSQLWPLSLLQSCEFCDE